MNYYVHLPANDIIYMVENRHIGIEFMIMFFHAAAGIDLIQSQHEVL